ncbi:hydrogenase accessory protein HypB [Candidatus Bathyarchaeota archaeon]|nr:MAG: hydrogenase accessory protein HypB [Candidatus Hecatellales archaeon]RLI35791.1 MAG: hydrogenase accessory protein HypB [Candidatus Bathyarchaeota archaeon]
MVKVVEAREGEALDIELDLNLQKKNLELAEANRRLLEKYGIRAIDFMGSVGSGKTSLIERLVGKLKGKYRIGVIGGDLTTTIDMEILSRHGVQVVQVNTGRECHLDANLVARALQSLPLNSLDLIFIENVGNIICPADFPLGAHRRVAVVSVIDSPYIIVKHPLTFQAVDVVALNKVDLAEIVGVNVAKLEEELKKINPKLSIVKTSCKTGLGVDQLIEVLNL